MSDDRDVSAGISTSGILFSIVSVGIVVGLIFNLKKKPYSLDHANFGYKFKDFTHIWSTKPIQIAVLNYTLTLDIHIQYAVTALTRLEVS